MEIKFDTKSEKIAAISAVFFVVSTILFFIIFLALI